MLCALNNLSSSTKRRVGVFSREKHPLQQLLLKKAGVGLILRVGLFSEIMIIVSVFLIIFVHIIGVCGVTLFASLLSPSSLPPLSPSSLPSSPPPLSLLSPPPLSLPLSLLSPSSLPLLSPSSLPPLSLLSPPPLSLLSPSSLPLLSPPRGWPVVFPCKILPCRPHGTTP